MLLFFISKNVEFLKDIDKIEERIMKNKMIYEYKIHGLYYEKRLEAPNFSLMIDTLEIFCELTSGTVIGIGGYFPLSKAVKCGISLPNWKTREYRFNVDFIGLYESGMAYDILEIIPKSKEYFNSNSIKFDKEKGVIFIGCELSEQEKGIRIDDNILLGFDIKGVLKCVYIIPDYFI